MALSEQEVFNEARLLDEAVILRNEVRRITERRPELSLTEAYRIQAAGLRLREARGDLIVGYKMGLTSAAKMQQMGVNSPIAGVLTKSMLVDNTGLLRMGDHIHPKAEPEIAFRTAQKVKAGATRAEFIAACASIHPALEVIDSRYLNFDFTLPDVIADNCSSSGFILGPGSDPKKFGVEGEGLKSLRVELLVNSELRQQGLGSAILGNPVDSALALLQWLSEQGRELPEGAIVLAGGATAAESFKDGQVVEARVAELGTASFRAGS